MNNSATKNNSNYITKKNTLHIMNILILYVIRVKQINWMGEVV